MPGGPRRAALDPGEQRDQDQRHEVEEVALLDPAGELRRECRHEEQQPERDRDRRREVRVEPRVCVARDDDEEGGGDYGRDTEVQVELGHVVEEVTGDRAGVVATLAGDRYAPSSDENDCPRTSWRATTERPRLRDPVQRPLGDEGRADAAAEQALDERRLSAAAASATACGRVWYATPSRPTSTIWRVSVGRSSTSTSAEDHDEEERIEGVLGHDHAAVRERGKRDGEHRSEEREPLADETPREQVRRYGRERDQHRVDRLGGGIRVRDPVEEAQAGLISRG